MKKLFTLVALLTVFMGANAANWNKVKEINFSDYTGFPHYVMGYVPEWVDGVMTDYGANYRYETQENLDGDGRMESLLLVQLRPIVEQCIRR